MCCTRRWDFIYEYAYIVRKTCIRSVNECQWSPECNERVAPMIHPIKLIFNARAEYFEKKKATYSGAGTYGELERVDAKYDPRRAES